MRGQGIITQPVDAILVESDHMQCLKNDMRRYLILCGVSLRFIRILKMCHKLFVIQKREQPYIVQRWIFYTPKLRLHNLDNDHFC